MVVVVEKLKGEGAGAGVAGVKPGKNCDRSEPAGAEGGGGCVKPGKKEDKSLIKSLRAARGCQWVGLCMLLFYFRESTVFNRESLMVGLLHARALTAAAHFLLLCVFSLLSLVNATDLTNPTSFTDWVSDPKAWESKWTLKQKLIVYSFCLVFGWVLRRKIIPFIKQMSETVRKKKN